MEKLMRQKIPKLRSRKGMSLIELVVGITIIVIVFGATLSAMTNGYSNTIYNAEVNQTAVEGGSVNEVMAQALKNLGFEDKAACEKYFFGGSGSAVKDPNSDADNSVHAAGSEIINSTFDGPIASIPESRKLKYVAPDVFPSADFENQYTIITNAKSNIKNGAKSYEIKGVILKTSVTNVRGKLTNSSFIAYSKQSTT